MTVSFDVLSYILLVPVPLDYAQCCGIFFLPGDFLFRILG